jgi:hypothetical protein
MFFRTNPTTRPFMVDTTIFLSQHIYHKMLSYALASRGEISGFGKTQVVKHGGDVRVDVVDVRIFNQTVTAAHTRLPTDPLTQFFLELLRLGERPERWNLWWHSHCDMPVFFSSEDQSTVSERFARSPRLFSICINKAGEMVARQDVKGKLIDEPKIIVEQTIGASLIKECRKEVRQKIRYRGFDENTTGIHTPRRHNQSQIID